MPSRPRPRRSLASAQLRPLAPGLALCCLLACPSRAPTDLPEEPGPPLAPWAAFATEASAGGPRCEVSRPVDLGAVLSVRGGPADVRLAAGPSGGMVAWMQPHPTRPIGRLVAVRPLGRDGRPTGVVQTLQPPVGSVLKDIVADDGGFYVLVAAPDQPRANHAIAVRPDGSGLGEFREIAGAGGLAPLSRGHAHGPAAAVLYGSPLGGHNPLWVRLDRDAAGVRVTTRSLSQGPGADTPSAWVGGDGRHALVVARPGAPLELIDGDVLPAGAALPDVPLGLDARWRGDAVDLAWTATSDGGASLRRALLRADGALELDPPGLPAFEHTLALAWSAPPLRGARRTRSGRQLDGDVIDVTAADPELTGALADAGWTWTGEAFVVGYPADTAGGITTRTVRVTCPRP
ncbi:MAG: hypothetical protein JNL82_15570 [Myxococcales bacterium]|nr:hypothetical protein [Myxococcales bacterium]